MPRNASALALTICCIALSQAVHGNGHSLRFFGTGSGDVDRVKIRVDDPATTLPGPPVDVGATDFTIEFWMQAAANDNRAPPITCGENANWKTGNIVLDRDRFNQSRTFGISLAGGRVAFGVTSDTGSYTLCGTAIVLDNAWHHIAVQRRRSDGTQWIFVDGVLDAQSLWFVTTGDVSYPDDGVPGNFCGGPCSNDPFLVLGAEQHDTGAMSPSYNGYLDELRVSSRLRYTANFARPAAPFAPDPYTAALYHFDEGTGNTVYDTSGRRGGPSDGVRKPGGANIGPLWTTNTPFNFGPLAVTLQTVVASGLNGLTAIENAGDGTNRLFLVRQPGIIHVLRNGAAAVLATPFLDISAANGGPVKQTPGSEQGLVGLAFHPNYKVNGYFYVFYTRALPSNPGDPGSQVVIARYQRSVANPDVADPNSGTILLTVDHPSQTNHNGGTLKFGKDGYLYIGTGDGGGGNDPFNAGQNLADRRGKMLRIDVDGAAPYAIPAANPFAGSTCTPTTTGQCPEILAYGLRNPWRSSFDRLTGDLLVGDVGQDTWEEVDFWPSAKAGGPNYGWSVCEGNHARGSQGAACTLVGDTRPILEYGHASFDAAGGNSITGGYRYRGVRVPVLSGRYVFGDYISGRVWAATVDGTGAWSKTLLTTVSGGTLSTFGEDETGEIYIGNYGGSLRRIVSVDADADGLPDWWENAYYGSTAGNANADTDGDGLTSLQEYTLQRDPRLASPSTVRGDLSGDGVAEQTWRNVGGANLFWTFDAAGNPVANVLPGVPTNWKLAAIADINGDSRGDLIWVDAAAGQVLAWLQNGITTLGTATLPNVGPGSGWSLVASGDFDGDGTTDLLWLHADGRVVGWRMAGGAAVQPFSFPTVPTGWEVVGTGDVDLDGKAEILWRRVADNAYFLWRYAESYSATLQFVGRPGANWRVVLLDDFDGDGAADIFWHDDAGTNAIWLGGDPAQAVFLPGTGPDWTPVASGRYDGGPTASVLWQRTDGVVAVWRFGVDLASPSVQFLTAVPAGWSAVRP
ncbi:MAG: PQQ-dependent sugar dehydrogenase [Burkholderiales bacterium]